LKGGNDEMLRHDPAIANLQNRVFNFKIVIIKDLLRKKFLEITEEVPVILGWARQPDKLSKFKQTDCQILYFSGDLFDRFRTGSYFDENNRFLYRF
jgi:hypothetical protein